MKLPNKPDAVNPAMTFRLTIEGQRHRVAEEDILRNYPFTYRQLTDQLRRRYSNFIENRNYHRIRNAN